MPLKSYVGLPRAGKTYEVVVFVILPALRQGRRVISNIAGLNYDAMSQLLYSEGFAQENIGELVKVSHEQVRDNFFFRTDTDNENGVETFVQPGDLVALDEIWRFWKKRGDINERAFNFFRMHGHMSHPVTGLTCEIALITQSIRDINENIRDVLQETFQMVKNTKLGSSKSYIVHIFQKGSTAKSDLIRTLPPRFYNPEYFKFYKSHSQQIAGDAAATEKNPDDRGNILQGFLFKVGFPLAIVFVIAGAFLIYRFLHPASAKGETNETAKHAVTSLPSGDSVPSQSAAPVAPALPEVNESWRVVGFYEFEKTHSVVLVDASNSMRVLFEPPNVRVRNLGVEVQLPDGTFGVPWSSFDKEKSALP